MPSAAEAAGQQSALAAALEQGFDQLSQQTDVTFTLYTKVSLAPDSSVFWVATTQTLTVTGSLHYATDRLQNQDETVGSNHVLLTTAQEVTQFNAVAPTTLWIGDWPIAGGALQVVFSSRGFFYEPADTWHYGGIAVYPALSAQIVQTAADLPVGPIVSNSLPIWLAETTFNGGQTTVPVYPSFLVPDNIAPPYIAAHIEPSTTTNLQAMMNLGPWPGTLVPNSGASPLHTLASSQLMRDDVELTLYGFTNEMALQYLAQLLNDSLTLESWGFADDPVIRDEKRTQVELATIAQKKTLRFRANYYQATADAIARRLILSASVSSITVQRFGSISLSGALTQRKGSVAIAATFPMAGPMTITQRKGVLAISGGN